MNSPSRDRGCAEVRGNERDRGTHEIVMKQWSLEAFRVSVFRGADPKSAPVPVRRRFQISIALGLLAGLRAAIAGVLLAPPRDIGQLWFAARAFLHGQDPYALIGPGLKFSWPWPLFYPLPAAVAVIPITPLPVVWAGVAFAAIAGGCFAWALLEHGYPPLLGFMSAAMVMAAQLVQWSPLFAASLVLPPLAFFAIAKPPVGAAMFAARPTWWAVAGAIVLSAVAFIGQPDWVHSWREAFDRGARAPNGLHFTAPILQPGGALALACLLRWRRPEARLVATMACVPQSLIVYETLPLFLVPRTLVECSMLLILSYLAQMIIVVSTHSWFEAVLPGGRWLIWLLYIPVTLMVLRRQNVGCVPQWIEERVVGWPRWLRGCAADDATA